MIDNIKKLCAISGVSGCEDLVADEIVSQIGAYCDCRRDALGNIIAFKKGKNTPAKKLVFSAHMDEVGFIVTDIEESGLLRFAVVGGIDNRVIVGKSVLVGKNNIYGCIGAKAVHLAKDSEKETPIEPDSLYIDIGAENKADALKYVALGDRAVFNSRFAAFGDNMIMGRALDDRAGCAAMIELIKDKLEYDCWFAFTTQEETGTTGAKAAAYAINADVAVAVETTTASDIPEIPPHKVVCRLSDGPVVSFMDKGTIYDTELYNWVLELAKQNGIKCQSKAGVYGGNESRSFQTAGAGCRVIGISMPCRYLHSPSCVLNKNDIENTVALLKAIVNNADKL
ncbi:MAG TPA: cellulase [Ruminococcaceae bacterium]|nr:cellulase [Oscillospiraceae bacterium]